MSIANLQFSRLFINVIHPLYISKQNLQAAMDKEDCRSRHLQSSIIMNFVTQSKVRIVNRHLILQQIFECPPGQSLP